MMNSWTRTFVVVSLGCFCFFYLTIYFYASGAHPRLSLLRLNFTLSSSTFEIEPGAYENSVDLTFPPYNDSIVEATFEQRRVVAKAACRKRYGMITENTKQQRAMYTLQKNRIIKSTFFVDETKKLLICVIAKVASSNWKSLLLYTSENATFESPDVLNDSYIHHAWPNHLSTKSLYALTPAMLKLKLPTYLNYTKVVWVRNPFVRLVSAWNSKLAGRNAYYSGVYGHYIQRKYRNQTEEYKNHTIDFYRNDSSVTLEEFYSYVRKEVRAYQMSDVHWSVFNTQCLPCYIDYQYIGKLEHWYPEAHYVWRKLVNQPNATIEFKEKYNSTAMKRALRPRKESQDNEWKNMIKRLPISLLKAVKQTFTLDFDIFGYDVNEFIPN